MTVEATQALQVSCVQMHWAEPIEFNLGRTVHYIRSAAAYGSRVVLFPEANLTSYYFPYAVALAPEAVQAALDETCQAAADNGIQLALAGSLSDEHIRRLLGIGPDYIAVRGAACHGLRTDQIVPTRVDQIARVLSGTDSAMAPQMSRRRIPSGRLNL